MFCKFFSTDKYAFAADFRCRTIERMKVNSNAGLRIDPCMRTLGRKTVATPMPDDTKVDSIFSRRQDKSLCCQKSLLESLPQDILIKLLCCVNHDDLKRLVHVSKTIREAALIAKRCYFAYNTPMKVSAFRTSIDLENMKEFDVMELPNAPKQPKVGRTPLRRKNLADISVALFASPEGEGVEDEGGRSVMKDRASRTKFSSKRRPAVVIESDLRRGMKFSDPFLQPSLEMGRFVCL